ncbi:MAG: NAD(P)-dependent oxidoreductase [Propionivibrio sp.]
MLTHAQLLQLKRWNTPTIYNGWEQITAGDASRDGFNREATTDYMPQMGVMVGRAVTVVCQPSVREHKTANPNAWNDYYAYVAAQPGPKIVLVQDLDKPGFVGAFWGEVNASIHRSLGCVGTITDGCVRDLDEMTNVGFKALAQRLCVGHAFSWPVRWGCDVEVFGTSVRPGQLIHADQHGFLAIPAADEAGLLAATDFMDDSECQHMLAAAGEAAGRNTPEHLQAIAESVKTCGASVVLDGHTLNPGDLSWEGIAALGETTIHAHTPPEEIVERAADAQIVITNKTPLSRETIDALPQLRYIGILATGYNVVDVAHAQSKNIVVTNIPTYGTASVAQATFALLLELCHHVHAHDDAVKNGEWSRSRDFCFWKHPQIELAGKTLGVVGFGRIGQHVADIAAAFGMQVVACDRSPDDQSARANLRWVGLEQLLRESDVVSLHCPLTADNQGLINQQSLALMKESAFLINTARGPLVVDADLAAALDEGVIAGAALDVLSVEPPPPDHPLLRARNCIVTPHIAWATREARSRLMDIATGNVKAWLAGKPANLVAP